MSLDYEYLFSEIDKAKKKKPKHYVPWNSPESKKLQEANTKEQKEQKESGNVSQPKYVKGKETDSRNKPFKGYTKKPGKGSTNQEDIPVKSSTISDIPKPKGAELKRRVGNAIVDQKRRDDKKRIKEERDRVMRVRSELQERAAKRRDAKEEAKKKKEEKKVRAGGGQKKQRGNLEFEYGQQGGATRDAREEQSKEREDKTVTETATVAGKKREFKRRKTDNEVVADAISAESNIHHRADQAMARKKLERERERAAKIQAEAQGMEGMTDLERQEAQVKEVKTRERKRRQAATHFGIPKKKKPKEPKTEEGEISDDERVRRELESRDKDEDTKKSLWKSWLKIKAEEGIGGMNMGAQRGLGHEAGYKQDSGQSTQITEVKEEKKEKEKSAYQTDQQDEGTDVDPNKQQIPPSKPKTDTFKALYKKALVTKYNNIYKPANL